MINEREGNQFRLKQLKHGVKERKISILRLDHTTADVWPEPLCSIILLSSLKSDSFNISSISY